MTRANLPRHIAFIMDGNGRWAVRRGLPRMKGHERGADAIRAMVEELLRRDIPEATFYALSSENFARRPAREISRLLKLLVSYLRDQHDLLCKEQIRLKVIGRTGALPDEVRDQIAASERLSAAHDRLVLRLAINYGGRLEILDAARRFAALPAARRDAMAPDAFRCCLYDPSMTDPDLLIRTGGLSRLSNFLLWQCPYTELYITRTLWPAFRARHLEQALDAYARTARKFGAVK